MAGPSVRGFPKPPEMIMARVGVCKWGCGRPVEKPAIYWHRDCLKQYNLHTRASDQKDFLIERDGQRCAMRGCGAVPLKWLHDDYGHPQFADSRRFYKPTPDELAKLWPTDPAAGKKYWDRTEAERGYGEAYRVWQVCALEVDHRVPLWSVASLPDGERRPYFGPANLWLLCPRCHKVKTAREAADRAAQRRLDAAQARLPL